MMAVKIIVAGTMAALGLFIFVVLSVYPEGAATWDARLAGQILGGFSFAAGTFLFWKRKAW